MSEYFVQNNLINQNHSEIEPEDLSQIISNSNDVNKFIDNVLDLDYNKIISKPVNNNNQELNKGVNIEQQSVSKFIHPH